MESDDRKPPLRRFTAKEERRFADEDKDLGRKRREAKELLEALEQAKQESGTRGTARDFGFAYIGFRAPIDLKSKLEAAARAAGRSLSSEVQFRLECSLRSQTAFTEALELVFDTAAEGDFPAEDVTAWLKRKFDGRTR
jgi:hypothetical protein